MGHTFWDTPTMAELFVQQGHLARARAIYRKIAQTAPADMQIAARLAYLEKALRGKEGENMSFREHIQRLVEQTPGATACVLMGFDGIAVDSYEIGGSAIDIPNLLIEYASAAQTLRDCNQTQPLIGQVTELTIQTEHLTCLLRLLNETYFIAMVLNVPNIGGKARYLMRQVAPRLLAELS